jgi:hypothetical protein
MIPDFATEATHLAYTFSIATLRGFNWLNVAGIELPRL